MILYHLPPLTQRKPYLPPSISEHKNNGNMLFGTSPFAFIRDSLIPFLLEVRWNKYQSLLSLGVTGTVPVSVGLRTPLFCIHFCISRKTSSTIYPSLNVYSNVDGSCKRSQVFEVQKRSRARSDEMLSCSDSRVTILPILFHRSKSLSITHQILQDSTNVIHSSITFWLVMHS